MAKGLEPKSLSFRAVARCKICGSELLEIHEKKHELDSGKGGIMYINKK
ncbi:MAG: hypothetical protein NUV67_04885 [archaeon]|nr:hypothetical protein [archaeon]